MSAKKSKQNFKSKDSKGKAAASEPAKTGLPFEPASNRKKPPKQPSTAPSQAQPTTPAAKSPTTQADRRAAVPEAVSRRMGRRMAFFSGIPTSLGVLTFVVSYIIVTQHWLKLPNSLVLLVSLGWFGLGVLGLSYGVFSASWDEDRTGSWHGWEEFRVNFGRAIQSWRAGRQTPGN
jgi:VIT1/CCC1 family predicted Fe2+/Mn2+ transporter